MAHDINLCPEELRQIIMGEIHFRKCPDCQGKGETWYIEYTLRERPHDSLFKDITEDEFTNFSADDYPDWGWAEALSQECETCNTVGYVSNISEFF